MNKVVTMRTGNKYTPDYVDKLYRGIQRNTTEPFEFVVVTKEIYPTWWNKLTLFPPEERIIWMDLDTVIVGNIDFLFEYQGNFAILRDAYRKDGIQAAIMSINAEFGHDLRRLFEIDPKTIMKKFYSDQEFIQTCVTNPDIWQEMYPGKFRSYKADGIREGNWFDDLRIVFFHGSPMPHEVSHDWMAEHWR